MRRIVLLPLLLLALLAAVPLAIADEPEEADESALVEDALDEALEECEDVLLCEEEAREADEAEEAEAEASDPPECVLRSAKAHAVLRKNKLKLTVGYTTSEPTRATVKVRYGSNPLGSFKRHLRQSGVLRLTRKLKGEHDDKHSQLRIELNPEGVGCPSRRLVLFPK